MRISDWSSDVCSSDLAHRPQGHKGVEVLRGDLEPTRAPLAERLADHEEFVARRCELVVAPASVGLGCRHDDIEPFELLEPLREHGAGESGRALQNLTEVSAATSSEEQTSVLQSLMRTSYAVFCLKKHIAPKP